MSNCIRINSTTSIYQMVTHCICHGRSLAELKKIAEDEGISEIEGLIEKEYCSCGCRLCVPYIRMMLETGRTKFHPDEAEPVDSSNG